MKALIEALKFFKLWPESGFGDIVIKIQGHKIYLCEKKEQLKIQD